MVSVSPKSDNPSNNNGQQSGRPPGNNNNKSNNNNKGNNNKGINMNNKGNNNNKCISINKPIHCKVTKKKRVDSVVEDEHVPFDSNRYADGANAALYMQPP